MVRHLQRDATRGAGRAALRYDGARGWDARAHAARPRLLAGAGRAPACGGPGTLRRGRRHPARLSGRHRAGRHRADRRRHRLAHRAVARLAGQRRRQARRRHPRRRRQAARTSRSTPATSTNPWVTASAAGRRATGPANPLPRVLRAARARRRPAHGVRRPRRGGGPQERGAALRRGRCRRRRQLLAPPQDRRGPAQHAAPRAGASVRPPLQTRRRRAQARDHRVVDGRLRCTGRGRDRARPLRRGRSPSAPRCGPATTR